ncbi:Protein of unknown function [Gryllus bimaculatus]|nr:Protein of unknown function [Gryllus bimaculatus]
MRLKRIAHSSSSCVPALRVRRRGKHLRYVESRSIATLASRPAGSSSVAEIGEHVHSPISATELLPAGRDASVRWSVADISQMFPRASYCSAGTHELLECAMRFKRIASYLKPPDVSERFKGSHLPLIDGDQVVS